MNTLPHDVLEKLLSYLSRDSVLAVGGCDRRLRAVVLALPIFTSLVVRLDSRSEDCVAFNVLALFRNAERLEVSQRRARDKAPLRAQRGGKVEGEVGITKLKMSVPLAADFLGVLSAFRCLETLNLRFLPQASLAMVPFIALPTLRTLLLPDVLVLDPPSVSHVLSNCALRTLSARTSLTPPDFWRTVAATTPEPKVRLLESLTFAAYGFTSNDDGDPHINAIVTSFPSLRRLSFKGSLEYLSFNTLASLHPPPPPAPSPDPPPESPKAGQWTPPPASSALGITELILPWPQKDYTPEIIPFLQTYPRLTACQFQARDDHLLALLAQRFGETLAEVHLACTESVTSDGIAALIKAAPKLQHLSLYFYDGHIWDAQISDAIALSPVASLWLGTLAGTTIGEDVRIASASLRKLVMNEFAVRTLRVDCPGLRKFLPPKDISDADSAAEIYGKAYPGRFVVRVSDEKLVDVVVLQGTETVKQLVEVLVRDLGKSLPIKLVLGGKSLKDDMLVKQIIKSGAELKLMHL